MRKFLLFFFVIPGALLAQTKATIVVGPDSTEINLILPEEFLHDNEIHLSLQFKVEYLDVDGKKQTLRPKELDKLIFTYKGQTFVMVTQPNILKEEYGNVWTKQKEILVQQNLDGELKLYTYYYWADILGNPANPYNMNAPVPFPKRLIKLGDKGIQELPEVFSFRKEMKKLLSNCPPVCEKLESKEYQRDDIDEIVEMYNRECSLNPNPN